MSATTGVIPRGAVPERPKASPPEGTSPELVVRELSRQISTREETRALKILRGKTGSGLGLAAIMVLSSVAVFAGTYLWTQAARERGALRTRESDVRAPEETAPAAQRTAPSPAESPAPKASAAPGRSGGAVSVQTRTDPGPEAKVEAASAQKAAGPRPEREASAKPEPESEAILTELFPEPAEPEDDQTPVFTINAPAPSSGARPKPQTDAWAELVGPAFDPGASAAEKDERER